MTIAMTIATSKSENFTTKVADRVIAIASSKGGINALKQVLSELPADFPGAVIVVQHLSSLFKSHLAEVLDRYTQLQVLPAREGAKLLSGTVHVAPPDYHIIVNRDGSLSLSQAAKEHFVRPSAEYTFKSLADSYQDKAIAVVLTGYDGDGSEGVQKIKAMGGRVIAQNQDTAEVFSMPKSAIETGCVDRAFASRRYSRWYHQHRWQLIPNIDESATARCRPSSTYKASRGLQEITLVLKTEYWADILVSFSAIASRISLSTPYSLLRFDTYQSSILFVSQNIEHPIGTLPYIPYPLSN